MTVLSAQSIRKFGIFTPFSERAELNGMTFGLGPAGYDVRIAEAAVVPPGAFMLVATLEHFSMPTNLIGFVHDKSTLARQGLALQNTVVEPGWRGFLTLELSNHGNATIMLCAGSPIAQVVFQFLDQPTELPYRGKYQDQAFGPQPAILK